VHENVLPLMGVMMMTESKFAMISEWMPNGKINEYVKAHPGVNRLHLVRFVFKTCRPRPIDNLNPIAGRCR
jgi:hypothetical protein